MSQPGSAWSGRAEAYAASQVHARGASLARLLELAAAFDLVVAPLVDESALAPDLDDGYERLERTRDPDHRSLRDADGWRQALMRAGFERARADADTRERIEVAAWLERVAAGEVTAFEMPMVVAHARAPASDPSDPASDPLPAPLSEPAFDPPSDPTPPEEAS